MDSIALISNKICFESLRRSCWKYFCFYLKLSRAWSIWFTNSKYLLNIVSIVLLGIFNLTFINRKLYQMDFVFLRISLLCTRNSGKEILCTALLFYHSFMTCKTRSYLDCFGTKMYCSLKLCELFWFIVKSINET